MEHFIKVVNLAPVTVLQFHGVPDEAHPWVHTPQDNFRRYMEYLKKNGFHTLALRDLEPFLGAPHDPMLTARHPQPKDGKLPLPVEVESSRRELAYWRGVTREHGYSAAEATTGDRRTRTGRPPRQRLPLAAVSGWAPYAHRLSGRRRQSHARHEGLGLSALGECRLPGDRRPRSRDGQWPDSLPRPYAHPHQMGPAERRHHESRMDAASRWLAHQRMAAAGSGHHRRRPCA